MGSGIDKALGVRDLKRQIEQEAGEELSLRRFSESLGTLGYRASKSLAARSTADFIKTVGFYPAGRTDSGGNDIGGTPVYVDFKYPKETQPYQPAVIAVTAANAIPAVGDPAFPLGMAPAVTVVSGGAANDGVVAHAAGFPIYVPGVPAVAGVAGSNAVLAVYQDMKFSVPILTMLPARTGCRMQRKACPWDKNDGTLEP